MGGKRQRKRKSHVHRRFKQRQITVEAIKPRAVPHQKNDTTQTIDIKVGRNQQCHTAAQTVFLPYPHTDKGLNKQQQRRGAEAGYHKIEIVENVKLLVCRIGIPTALQETLTSISLLVLEAIINSMGYVASAAVGVCNRVFNVAIVPGLAFAAAISAMVAQNTGAGEYLRGKKCLRVGLGLTVAVAALIFLLMAFFPAQIIGIFTHDKAVIASGVEYMTFYKFDCMICSIAFCINGYINGTGHTRYTMIVNLVASFAVRLPLVWLISRIAGTLFYISLGLPAASLVQVCVGVGFLLFAKSEREQRQKLRLAE